MSDRVRGLQRLADLYGMVERMHSVDLRVASDSVTESVQALDRRRRVESEQLERGRSALEDGDREEWTMAESQAELAQAQAERVDRLRQAREILRESALDAYRASRLRMEQMQQLVRSVRDREATVARRRFQAALDDRHLSRTIWRKTKDEATPPLSGSDE